ncbi:MAG TPA: shikimate kinase [Spirochaetia bacterium]|nr:shikimate kinase [Spirochaetia bacterium]
MKNIILTGMPGAGKSTIGVILAKTLKMPFIDTDLLIQEREGRLLQEIIDEKGLGYFLSVEERVLLGLEPEGTVVSPGGSIVYSRAAVEHFKRNSLLVYLRLSYESIRTRVRNMDSRGIVFKEGQDLRDLYLERVPLYEKYADHTIDCEGKDMEEIVRELKRGVGPLVT